MEFIKEIARKILKDEIRTYRKEIREYKKEINFLRKENIRITEERIQEYQENIQRLKENSHSETGQYRIHGGMPKIYDSGFPMFCGK